MMASRRSAVRSARLDAGFGDRAFDKADLGALTGAAFSPCRPMAGFPPRRPLADFDGAPPEVPDPVRVFDMDYI
jgi:hypothetical protein